MNDIAPTHVKTKDHGDDGRRRDALRQRRRSRAGRSCVRARADRPAGRADASLPAAVPLLLQPARARAGQHRADDRPSGRRSCARRPQLGILQIHLSGGEPTARTRPRRHRQDRGRGRPLHQPHHRRRAADARAAGEARRTLGLDHVQLSIQDVDTPPRTPTASPATRAACAKKNEVGRLGARARHAADHQRADPPPQHQKRRGDHRLRGRAGRRPRRDRPRPVLRLGAEEPRRADADARGRSWPRPRSSRRRASA